ncbi:MAG: hypothetical protein KDC36_03715 [Thermoleophilia bacterium]|nr:hypothetical protein [Thermoleophilia bacterium]
MVQITGGGTATAWEEWPRSIGEGTQTPRGIAWDFYFKDAQTHMRSLGVAKASPPSTGETTSAWNEFVDNATLNIIVRSRGSEPRSDGVSLATLAEEFGMSDILQD